MSQVVPAVFDMQADIMFEDEAVDRRIEREFVAARVDADLERLREIKNFYCMGDDGEVGIEVSFKGR